MAIKMIDDSILQDIAESIQAKDGLGKMTPGQMPGRIDNLNGGGDVPNPDDPLLLVDWDGTLLYSYTYEEAQQISEFPDPPTHDGLTFQSWNRSEVVAKTWLQNHRGTQLKVGATYTPTDGQDHNYRRSPRLSAQNQIYMQHRATTRDTYREFHDYYSLARISLPNGITSIGESTFYNCYSLTTVSLPNSVTNIYRYVFYYCYSLTTIILPDSLTSIGNGAFHNCYSLTTIILPDSLTSIGNDAFYNCYSLVAVVLSNNLTSIGSSTFRYCRSLSKIDIPSSVTLINSAAFEYCTSLVDVILRGKPALGGSNVFSNNPSSQRFYVHRSDLAWFETATNWSAIYGDGKIVAAADYIDYLQSIGIDTTDFEGE